MTATPQARAPLMPFNPAIPDLNNRWLTGDAKRAILIAPRQVELRVATIPANVKDYWVTTLSGGSVPNGYWPAPYPQRMQFVSESVGQGKVLPKRLEMVPRAGPSYGGHAIFRSLFQNQTLNIKDEIFGTFPYQPGNWGYTYTFFPGVFSSDVSAAVVPYIVIYSAQKPEPTMLYHTPSYERLNGINRKDIYIDFALLNDSNSHMAVISAVKGAAVFENSYLTFSPFVSEADFKKGGQVWRVRGASLGLSVAAALRFFPPIMYTGYLRNFGPHMQPGKGTQNTFPAGFPSDPQGRIEFNINNLDWVEDVQKVGMKASWAVETGFPLIIPYKTSFGWPFQSFDRKMMEVHKDTYMLATQWYSAMKLESGLPYNDVPVSVAGTLVEACVLGYLMGNAYALDPSDGFMQFKLIDFDSTSNDVWAQKMLGAEEAFSKKKVQRKEEIKVLKMHPDYNAVATTLKGKEEITNREETARKAAAERDAKIATFKDRLAKRIKVAQYEALPYSQQTKYEQPLPPPKIVGVPGRAKNAVSFVDTIHHTSLGDNLARRRSRSVQPPQGQQAAATGRDSSSIPFIMQMAQNGGSLEPTSLEPSQAPTDAATADATQDGGRSVSTLIAVTQEPADRAMKLIRENADAIKINQSGEVSSRGAKISTADDDRLAAYYNSIPEISRRVMMGFIKEQSKPDYPNYPEEPLLYGMVKAYPSYEGMVKEYSNLDDATKLKLFNTMVIAGADMANLAKVGSGQEMLMPEPLPQVVVKRVKQGANALAADDSAQPSVQSFKSNPAQPSPFQKK